MTKPTKAVILVAGRGKRMRPLSDRIPKCLIKIKGKPILINALEQLAKNNFREVILVVGYMRNRIKYEVREKFGKMKIRYVENHLYNKSENSYSLWLGIKDLNEDLLIMEGDVFFENKLLKDFLKDKRANLTLVEKYNPDLDGTFIDINKKGIVVDWVHKKDRPPDFVFEDKYKTINIHKFSKNFLKKWLIPTLEKHIKETAGKEPIEFIFKEIVKKGGKIYTFINKKAKWIEIDEIKDLKMAKEMFK